MEGDCCHSVDSVSSVFMSFAKEGCGSGLVKASEGVSVPGVCVREGDVLFRGLVVKVMVFEVHLFASFCIAVV